MYIWQATDDLVYFARTDGVQVALTSRRLDDIDLALSVTFQQVQATILISSIVAVPVSG